MRLRVEGKSQVISSMFNPNVGLKSSRIDTVGKKKPMTIGDGLGVGLKIAHKDYTLRR